MPCEWQVRCRGTPGRGKAPLKGVPYDQAPLKGGALRSGTPERGALRMMRITDEWVLERRGPKAALDPMRAYAAVFEEELDARGELVSTGVIFLTNRECPFRCVFC